MPVENGAIVTGAQTALIATQAASTAAILEGTTSPDLLALAAGPCGLFGPPRPTFFYPRIQWNQGGSGFTIDFCDPVVEIRVQPGMLRGQNIALSGKTETLAVRDEYRLSLAFQALQTDIMDRCFVWFSEHAVRGGQSAITLDRFNTCNGQWEYDRFNTYFSRAEIINNPIEPVRTVRSRPLYTYQFVFRQGS